MKIRNGFVSNSSTSSFVVVGTIIDYPSMTADEQDALYEKVDMVLYPGEDDVPDYVAGFTIADINEESDSESGEITLDDLNDYVERLVKTFGVKREDVKIYYGTRMS
jgi:hypothetical protein